MRRYKRALRERGGERRKGKGEDGGNRGETEKRQRGDEGRGREGRGEKLKGGKGKPINGSKKILVTALDLVCKI